MDKDTVVLTAINKDLLNVYSTGATFGWMPCYRDDITGDIVIVSSIQFCREGIVGYLSKNVDKMLPPKQGKFYLVAARVARSSSVYNRLTFQYEYAPISDAERQRLCTEAQTAIDKSMQFINMIELECGWPLTRYYNASLKQPQDKTKAAQVFYCIEASGRWANSPQMVSLLVLLLRNGAQPRFPVFENIEELVKVVREVGTVIHAYHNDRRYLRSVAPLLSQLLKNHRVIFPPRAKQDLWKDSQWGHEGIYVLTSGKARNSALRARFARHKEQWSKINRSERAKATRAIKKAKAMVAAECTEC